MQSTVRYNFKLRLGKIAAQKLWDEWCRTRFVWNDLVAKGKKNYRAHKAGEVTSDLSYGRAAKGLTELRAANEWLRDGSQVVQQQAVRRWAQTYWSAVKTKKGRPKFKSAKRDCPTLEYTINGFKLRDSRLVLAGGIVVPVVWSRGLPSPTKSCTVFRDRVGDWSVSFVVQVEDAPLLKNAESVGIDWGVATTATCSDGSVLEASGEPKRRNPPSNPDRKHCLGPREARKSDVKRSEE